MLVRPAAPGQREALTGDLTGGLLARTDLEAKLAEAIAVPPWRSPRTMPVTAGWWRPPPTPMGTCSGCFRAGRTWESLHRREDEREEATEKFAKSATGTGKTSKGFADEERAAMKERGQELKVEARRGSRAGKADGESDVLAKIAERTSAGSRSVSGSPSNST